jgi:SAM-dependent methyltransferase
MHTESAARRLQPRIIDSDWLVLRGMRPAIDRMAAQAGSTGSIAVDLGCGSQPYRPIFDALGITYRGADLEGADIRIHENGRVDLADESADLVLSFQVLEHVRDVGQYLAEALRIVRKDGWLILSTHGTWLYHPHPEDHHRWTRQGLLAELAASGFETTECVAIVGPLGWTTMVRLTCWYQACRRIRLIGRPLAALVALVMNARGYLEELITPEWVRRDNACVYVTLSRPMKGDVRG